MTNEILINTVTAWDEPPRARHQIAYSLSKTHKISFITRNKVGFPKVKFFNISNNITIIEPTFPIGYKYRYRLPIINELYQLWLYKKIKRRDSFLYCINFDFTATLIFRYFKRTIYYCNDDYIGNSNVPNLLVDQYHKICEPIVIRKSILCVATSKFLVKKLQVINPNTYYIPLGAPNLNTINVVARKAMKPKIIKVNLMYVVTRHLDYELINYLISKSDISVTCIGPSDPDFEGKLNKSDKLELKDILKGDQLYHEINKADVGIAPYIIDKVNKGGTPNKLWQYFALGKPVVITNLPNLSYMSFPDKLLYISPGDSHENFYALIKTAHFENSDLLIQERIRCANENSWEKRADEFLKITNDALNPENVK